ncbi:MAG TPA: hypothetical protein VHD32_01510 [Candidatus Didemnitutus sp.]|nr:hypothetical protein [Candidatus Didemnitutus sp.]
MPALLDSATGSREERRQCAIAHMNRGHEGILAGHPEALDAALSEYERAIEALTDDEGTKDVAWGNSLAAAWLNRGQLLHRRHGIARATDALRSFDEAERLLASLSSDFPWPRRNRIGAAINRANLLLDLGRPLEAHDSAALAVVLGLNHERANALDAELGVKARRTQCDVIGRLLVPPGANQRLLADQASDLVDDALALIRLWAPRVPGVFGLLSRRLFRYGAELYRLHQPQFLAEFIRENGAAENELIDIARECLERALADRPAGRWLTIGDPASELYIQRMRELEALHAALPRGK